MDALKSLLDNEKGLVGVAILIAATVLFGMDKLTVDDWKSLMQWVFGIYAGSTALHQAAGELGKGNRSEPTEKKS